MHPGTSAYTTMEFSVIYSTSCYRPVAYIMRYNTFFNVYTETVLSVQIHGISLYVKKEKYKT